MRRVPRTAAYAIWAPAAVWNVRDFMLFAFFRAHSQWCAWDMGRMLFLLLLLLLLLQIRRGTFLLRLLLPLLLLLLLLLLTLHVVLLLLVAPALAFFCGLYIPLGFRRPYGCNTANTRVPCP